MLRSKSSLPCVGLILISTPFNRLLEKRSAIYSSRPPNYIANELICKRQTHILFTPYGSEFKALRKSTQGLFAPRELAAVLPVQQAEAAQTAYDILREPGQYYEHIQRYTTAVILASVYGQRGETFDSPNIQALYDVQNRFTALLEPGAAPPVDGITFLKHIPEFLAPWKQRARKIRRDQREIYFRLYNGTKERMGRGIRVGCFMERLIDDQVKNNMDDEHTAYLGGVFMEAGSDTTSSTLLSFLLGMVENPVALKRAQEDVDRVCGVERSPTLDDLENLPYIESCMHEVSTFFSGFRILTLTENSRFFAGGPSQQVEFHTCSRKKTLIKAISSPQEPFSSLIPGPFTTMRTNMTTRVLSIPIVGSEETHTELKPVSRWHQMNSVKRLMAGAQDVEFALVRNWQRLR